MDMTDTTQTLHPALTHYITWLKAHEKLLIIMFATAFGFHFYGDVLNFMTGRDKRHVEADTQVALAAQQKIQVDAQANVQLLQQLADLKLQQATLSAQLQLAMQKRQQQTNEQKKKNDVSIPSELAVRTSDVLRVQPQEIVANDTNGTLTFSASASHANVNALEDGLQAKADVLDLSKKVEVCAAVTAKQDEIITGVRNELSDEKLSHQADVKLERANTQLAKDEGKKQFRNGFKWGFITGIGVSIAAKVGHVIGF